MSEYFDEEYDQYNGFYVLYKNRKFIYNNLYDKITTEQIMKKNEETQNSSKKINDDLQFDIILNDEIFTIYRSNEGYYIYLKNNETTFAFIKKKITITSSSSSKKYFIYNMDQIQKFLDYENLKINNITINPNINNISDIFDSNCDKFTIIEKKIEIIEKKVNISKTKDYCKIIKLKDFIIKKINYVKYNEESLYYKTKDRDNLLDLLSKRKYTFLCGPSGIGKTVTLLNLRAMKSNNVLYFNLKNLINYYDYKEIKKNILIELSYCFKNDNELYSFVDTFLEEDAKKISLKSNIDIIHFYLKKIIENFESIQNLNIKKLFIILDQYKRKYDPNNALDNLLKSYTDDSLHYIKCSSMNEDNVREELEKYLFEKNDDILFVNSLVNYKNIIEGEDNTNKTIYLLDLEDNPKYIEDYSSFSSQSSNNRIEDYSLIIINNLSPKIKKEIINKSNIYNIQPLYIIKEILEKEGSEIQIQEFKKIYNYLPLKYIIPIKNDNKYTFHYSFKLLKKVFEEIQKQLIEELNFNYYEIIDSGSKAGFVFEDFVQSIFREGKKLFNDEKLLIKNEIKVNSIYNLNTIIFTSNSNDPHIIYKDDNNPIYKIEDIEAKKNIFKNQILEKEINSIIQKPCGEYYDLALLIPTKNGINREFDIFLCQITLDKDYSEFLGRKMIIESLKQIKKKFEIIFDIKLNKFYFSYILDKKRKGRTNIENYCKEFNNKLYYAFYDDKKLYSKNGMLFTIDLMKRNCLITELSQENINYNLVSYQTYQTLMNNSNKIIFKNNAEIQYDINEKEKNYIIEDTNLRCQIYRGKELKILLNKKRAEDNIKSKDSKKEKDNKKKILKKEEKKIHKNINNFIEVPKLNDIEKEIFCFLLKRNKKFNLSQDLRKKICIILENEKLEFEIIERGAFFPLNIYGLENYLILYYNCNDKNNMDKLILVKYSQLNKDYEFWSINEKGTLVDAQVGYIFLKSLNNPLHFFENYSSYLLKIKNEKENERSELEEEFSEESII